MPHLKGRKCPSCKKAQSCKRGPIVLCWLSPFYIMPRFCMTVPYTYHIHNAVFGDGQPCYLTLFVQAASSRSHFPLHVVSSPSPPCLPDSFITSLPPPVSTSENVRHIHYHRSLFCPRPPGRPCRLHFNDSSAYPGKS